MLDNESVVNLLDGPPYSGGKSIGVKTYLAECVLLAPCESGKIVAVGKNYRDHVKELVNDTGLPDNPILFIKPSNTVIGPKEPILLPPSEISRRIDYEGELAFVIGKTAKNVSAADAMDYIFGYTCLNDVTARDIQQKDGQWTRAKSFDTFAPIGPWIETEINPDNLAVTTTLNGEVRQQGRTSKLIWPVCELVEFISHMMTLMAGDIVTTGTPSGIGQMKDGDLVCIEIEGIGKLENPVRQL